MDMIMVALLSQAAPQQNNLLRMVFKASPFGKFILILLVVFSVVSWAVIIFKMLEYGRARRLSDRFMQHFRQTRNFSEIHKYAGSAPRSPLSEIFRSGYRELSLQFSPGSSSGDIDLESVHRSLMRSSSNQITRLERMNGFLATTAAVTPFIGLLGTVWGIVTAFHEIGMQMNANLATVAPGIAEALVATAMGLFAAIPAVIFYNWLLSRLKVLISTMEEFIMEFLNASRKLK
ncbi:MAG: MotA/TolQ/ExbB proton channel family protein [Acidobacteriota bacterium]|nr:MotA/TolQ/ExbB proton channel family protein [Acidobacteriota bacterium]